MRDASSDKKWYSAPRRNAIYRKKSHKKTPGKTARLYWNVGDARNRCRRRQVYRSTNVLAIVGARPPMQQGSVRSNWISPGLWGWHGLGLEQASIERSTSSWPARWPWILLQIYPRHQSALPTISCALEFWNRSRRPAWICKQMHPQLMTLFYNLLYKKASLKKIKNSIHGVNYIWLIIHIVLLCASEVLHLTWKYGTITRFFPGLTCL